MKRALVLSILLGLTLGGTQLEARSRDYPMQVQVMRSRWHGSRGGYRVGFGRANLISQQPGQPQRQGMDFTFDCSEPVRISFGPDTYPARYGKNPLEVIVGMPEPGSTKVHECTLKVILHDYTYERTGHGLLAAPLSGGPPVPINDENQ